MKTAGAKQRITFVRNVGLRDRDFMGDVAISLKVLPSSAEVDLGKIKAELQAMGAKEVREKDIAFGLKMIEVLFVIPDEEGAAPGLEEKIQKIEGVGSVETEGVTLI